MDDKGEEIEDDPPIKFGGTRGVVHHPDDDDPELERYRKRHRIICGADDAMRDER